MAIYETFILQDPSEIPEGKEYVLEIRDSETYETRVVKAVIDKSPKKSIESDLLRVRWQRGMPLPELWAIKIIEEVGAVSDNLKYTE